MVMGFMVAIMPFLGFPGGVKDVSIAVLGIMIAITGFLLGRRSKQDDRNLLSAHQNENTFVDNGREHREESQEEHTSTQ